MEFDIEKAITKVNADYFADRAIPGVDFEIPASIRKGARPEGFDFFLRFGSPSFAEIMQDRASELITMAALMTRTLGGGASIRKEPEPSIAMRVLGREICSDTRKYDERELRRAANHRGEK